MTLTPSEGYLMSRLDGVFSARAVLEAAAPRGRGGASLSVRPRGRRARGLRGSPPRPAEAVADTHAGRPAGPAPGRGRRLGQGRTPPRHPRCPCAARRRKGSLRRSRPVARRHRGGSEDGLLRPGPAVPSRHPGRPHRPRRRDPGRLLPASEWPSTSSARPRRGAAYEATLAPAKRRVRRGSRHTYPARRNARGARLLRFRERPCRPVPVAGARARKTWPGGRRNT